MKLIDILVEELPKRGGWPKGAKHAWCDPDGEIRFRNGGCEPDFYPEPDVDIECRAPNPYYEYESRYIITREQYEAALAAKNEGWIEWGGGECPMSCGTMVDVKYRDGVIKKGLRALIANSGRSASKLFWVKDNIPTDIIAYRLHQPTKSEQVRAAAWNAYVGIEKANDEADLNECIVQALVTTWGGEGLPPVGCEFEHSFQANGYLTWHRRKCTAVGKHGILCVDEQDIELYLNDRNNKFRTVNSEADKKLYDAKHAIAELCRSSASNGHAADLIYDAIAAGKIPGVKLDD